MARYPEQPHPEPSWEAPLTYTLEEILSLYPRLYLLSPTEIPGELIMTVRPDSGEQENNDNNGDQDQPKPEFSVVEMEDGFNALIPIADPDEDPAEQKITPEPVLVTPRDQESHNPQALAREIEKDNSFIPTLRTYLGLSTDVVIKINYQGD